MTRARCAECGALLACEYRDGPIKGIRSEMYVHPCGACLQEARADAIASYNDSRED